MFFSEKAYTKVPIKYYRKMNEKMNRNFPARFSKNAFWEFL